MTVTYPKTVPSDFLIKNFHRISYKQLCNYCLQL